MLFSCSIDHPNTRMDVVLYLLKIGLFCTDHELIKSNLEKAQRHLNMLHVHSTHNCTIIYITTCTILSSMILYMYVILIGFFALLYKYYNYPLEKYSNDGLLLLYYNYTLYTMCVYVLKMIAWYVFHRANQ